MFIECLYHAVLDTLKLLPFLYLTYLLMEFLERYAGERTERLIVKSGKAGPFLGALLGTLPQCGFSAAGAGLYAGRIISAGTLLAIFWSTSDEMLPILITGGVPPLKIVKILAVKVAVATLAGFAVDLIARKRARGENKQQLHIEELCQAENCHCEGHSIWYAALIHTANIVLVIFAVTLGLELLLDSFGAELLTSFLQSAPILSCLFAALVGLIPNCAASVAITQLYMDGMLSAGAMLAGLLTGAGIGLLVLFRSNRPMRDNFRLSAILLGVGVLFGVLFDLFSLGSLLGI